MKQSFYLGSLVGLALLLVAGVIYLALQSAPHYPTKAKTATTATAPADFQTEKQNRQGMARWVALTTSPLHDSSPSNHAETLPDTPEKQSLQAAAIQTNEAMKQALSNRDLVALEKVIDTLEQHSVPSLDYELPLLQIAAACLREVNSETQLAARDAMQKQSASTIRKSIRRLCEI